MSSQPQLRISENNYYSIQGFMRTELGLKGNEIAVYAIIYGFSQNREDWFTGSAQYIADWIGTSKRTVYDILKSLSEKGLIDKNTKTVNGVTFNEYKAIHGSEKTSWGVKKLHGGSEEISVGGSEKSSPNNISLNTINDIKDKKEKSIKKEKDDALIKSMLHTHTSHSELLETLDDFVEYRKAKKNPLSVQGCKGLLKKLSAVNDEEQIIALNSAMEGGWTSVYPKTKEELSSYKKQGGFNNASSNGSSTKKSVLDGFKLDITEL